MTDVEEISSVQDHTVPQSRNPSSNRKRMLLKPSVLDDMGYGKYRTFLQRLDRPPGPLDVVASMKTRKIVDKAQRSESVVHVDQALCEMSEWLVLQATMRDYGAPSGLKYVSCLDSVAARVRDTAFTSQICLQWLSNWPYTHDSPGTLRKSLP